MRQCLQFTELSIIVLRIRYRYELSHSRTNSIKSVGKRNIMYFLCFCHFIHIHNQQMQFHETQLKKTPLVNTKQNENCVLYTKTLVEGTETETELCLERTVSRTVWRHTAKPRTQQKNAEIQHFQYVTETAMPIKARYRYSHVLCNATLKVVAVYTLGR